MKFSMIEDLDTAGIIQTYITDRKTFRHFHELKIKVFIEKLLSGKSQEDRNSLV